MKKILLPDENYPLSPADITPEDYRPLTHLKNVDSYLLKMAWYAATVAKSFSFKSEDFLAFCRTESEGVIIWDDETLREMHVDLQNDGWIYLEEGKLYLSHQLITKLVVPSAIVKIELRHIELGVDPHKTPLERLNPLLVGELKEIIGEAKRLKYPAFNRKRFPLVAKGQDWLSESGRLTAKTMLFFFEWYPASELVLEK